MRICYLINSYPPRIGGAERLVEELARSLDSMGEKSIIITRRSGGAPIHEINGNRTIIRIPLFGPRALRAIIYRFFSTLLLFAARNRYDLIHAHSLDSPAVVGAYAAPILKKRFFVTIHNTGKVESLVKRKRGTKRFLRILETCEKIISINNDITEELLSSGCPEEKIYFLPNGVDTSRFSPAEPAEKERILQRLSIFDRTVYLFVGNLHSQKGIDVLIEAWRIFQQRVERESTILLIIGDGVMMNEVKMLVKDRGLSDSISILGRKNDPSLYYKGADCFVQPSRWEGLSIALLEAMASGLCVIATPVGGTRDIIVDRENGMLSPVDDPYRLAERLFEAKTNPRLRKKLAINARLTVEKAYSMTKCVQRHLDLYRETTERKGLEDDDREAAQNRSAAVQRDEQAAAENVEAVC